MALYRAKADGRGTHRFFEREMDRRLQSRRALELDLRKALATLQQAGWQLNSDNKLINTQTGKPLTVEFLMNGPLYEKIALRYQTALAKIGVAFNIYFVLAWRAGEFKVAREVLAKVMPADAAERTTRGWSAKMGWIDEPANDSTARSGTAASSSGSKARSSRIPSQPR